MRWFYVVLFEGTGAVGCSELHHVVHPVDDLVENEEDLGASVRILFRRYYALVLTSLYIAAKPSKEPLILGSLLQKGTFVRSAEVMLFW